MKHLYYPAYAGWIALAVLINVMGRRWLSARVRAVANIAWGVVACVFMLLASEPWDWFRDFRIGYWHAARTVFDDPTNLYGADELTFVNLPALALPFVPFARMGAWWAGATFAVLGAVAAAVAYFQLVRLARLDARGRWLLAGLFVLNGPLFYCLREANATVMVLPLLVCALAALQSGQDSRCGGLLGVAALVKPPLALLPAYYLLRKRWAVVGTAALVVLGVAGLSVVIFGLEVHRTWFERCVVAYSGRPVAAFNAQSVSSFLVRFLVHRNHLDMWVPVTTTPGFRALNQAVTVALLLGTLAVCTRAAGQNKSTAVALDFCLILCLSLVSSPLCWTHYFLLLLLPGALLLGNTIGRPSAERWTALAIAFALLSLPVRGWLVDRWWLAVLVSHYLAGALLLLAILAIARWRLVPAGGAVSGPPFAEDCERLAG